MNKEQHLTYELGITNVPSDVMCDDNGLEESVGMVYADGEHRVIQWPKELVDDVRDSNEAFKLLFVHHVPGGAVKYLVLKASTGALHWGYIDGNGNFDMTNDSHIITIASPQKILQVAATGQTIIINTTQGLQYAIWDVSLNKYRVIGQNLPEPDIKFGLYYGAYDQEQSFYEYKVSARLESSLDTRYPDRWQDPAVKAEWNDLCFGLYSKCEDDIKRRNAFSRPFFIRYALRMYDGSYTYISNPILAMPSLNYNCRNEAHFLSGQEYECIVGYSILYYQLTTDYSDYRDLISGIDIFVSDQVQTIDSSKDATISLLNGGRDGYSAELDNLANPTDAMGVINISGHSYLHFRDMSEIRHDITHTSVFYKISELDINDIDTNRLLELPINSGVISNLTTQPQLEYDDYFSRSPKTGELIKVYNNRLHMVGVSRGFFDGFTRFALASFQGAGYWMLAQVFIKASNGERVVQKLFRSNELFGIYFYYPDPRAYKVDIYNYNNDELEYSLELTEHPGLNGAYFFGNASAIGLHQQPAQTDYTFEPLDNKLLQSEVDNPFLFKADGEVTIGLGKVYNIASQTMALSQGQFGKYPLTAFCSDGIWGLEMDRTGVYVDAEPFSREIYIPGAPLIETDGAVFFASNKGLMMVVGNSVKCVSEQLSGKATGSTIVGLSFRDFLKDAFAAYDYRDSLLWLFNYRSGYEEQCYIYSIKTGTFATLEFGEPIYDITNAVPDYPDYILQHSDTLYTLLNRDDINDDTKDDYDAMLITRPMKLGDGLTLKNIMQMRNICHLNSNGVLRVRIYAKNDLNSVWTQLTHLRGTPWKYYRLQYDFSDMKATDRFAGTVLITQERRTNKLR